MQRPRLVELVPQPVQNGLPRLRLGHLHRVCIRQIVRSRPAVVRSVSRRVYSAVSGQMSADFKLELDFFVQAHR